MLRKEPFWKKLPVRHSYNLKSRSKSKHNCKYHKKGRPLKDMDHATSEQQECVICLNTQKLKVHKKLLCGHIFHNNCINRWLEYANSCPICRKPIMQSGEKHQDDHMQLQVDYIQLKFDLIDLQIERLELQIESMQLKLDLIHLKLKCIQLEIDLILLKLGRFVLRLIYLLQFLDKIQLFDDLGQRFDYAPLKLRSNQKPQLNHLLQQELRDIQKEFRNIQQHCNDIEQNRNFIHEEIHNLHQQQVHIRQELHYVSYQHDHIRQELHHI